jgi:anti-sigma-K factor RskA
MNVDCIERQDLILLEAAGALDEPQAEELRRHLATGCPQCAGYRAQAEAVLAMLPLSLSPVDPPAGLKEKILSEARRQSRMKIGSWDRIVLPAAVAAVLAVAVTLMVVKQFWPTNVHSPDDMRTIGTLEAQLLTTQSQISEMKKSLGEMEFAELTGPAQPQAVGHVFLDPDMKKWYFFTCGMRPAADGKTYELWLILGNRAVPAGNFDVNSNGVATLLGDIPPLPANTTVSLAVTDEPVASAHNAPTGQMQMRGVVE